MAMSPARGWLYVCSERSQYSSDAGLIAIRMKNSHTHTLVEGMTNANGIAFAPDGSLWIGEGETKGLIWRMAEPDRFPDNQQVDPVSLSSSNVALAPFYPAGRFNHRGIAFSEDGRFAYLADASAAGSLYRLKLNTHTLTVYHREKGWLKVNQDDATAMARKLGAARFDAIQDIERLPDGTLLLAESGSGRILQLHDDGSLPRVKPWLDNKLLSHPGDMAWDNTRQWLWIADHAAAHSVIWAWDGHKLHAIIRHPNSRFGGVLAVDGHIYVSLQRGRNNPAMIVLLSEKRNES